MKIFSLFGRQRRQEGMSLPEVMVASAVFAISLLGLMRYHQALSANFQHYWGQLKAVRYAYDQLEQYERLAGQIDWQKTAGEAIPRGWKVEFQREFRSWGCDQVTIKLTVHYNKPSKLERWFCTSGSIDV
ncbi:prepilin-type N-terminal cleavage/methylation domain-containing protein [Xenorhabdus sp. DI]|uniref:prepilin-type N-terminal cleavage/methylation domain-containing protein n=1 Tax=Xenorhabdus doucetiae TaxID=351671 RepID=UPI00198EC51B|nr:MULTISPECIES: prepilin-type N-terminal cleavage/methylation domain-containing protein [unclassified Xenorhabdus]MBD2784961.1 prepilin-type N-terminal cleavage/methylation domain-containing protein [Xenorhabdus sp. 3]MBD2790168.1 prepilin-type N-terminal cleavage/methylation domain-containing protein [Xenorhabdus sp. DI]